MTDEHPTKAELLQELQQLRQRVADLETAVGNTVDRGSMIDVLTKYQLLAAIARDVLLFVRARDGRILEANRAAEETYGYSRAELLDLTIYDLRAPSTQALVMAQISQADLQGIIFETWHRRRDGREFPVEVNSGGITLGDERILLSIVRDITTRRQAEEFLRQSEERFSQAFFHVPVALSLSRLSDGRIFEVNDRFLELYEFSRVDVIGHTDAELGLYPQSTERTELLGEIAAQGLVRDREVTGCTRSGALRQALLSAVPVQLNGEDCLLTMAIDITERKQMETALRQSEERFSKSFFNAPVALILTRLSDGRIFEVNDRFTELFEYGRADVIGHTTLELGLFVNPEERTRLVEQLSSRRMVRNYEVAGRTRSGLLRQVLLSIVPVELNVEDCLLTTIIDITERKLVETALQELNATLEERVQARTAELQIATQRVLELDRLKDDFISRINHELRTPLANVRLYADLLERGNPNKRAQYFQTFQQQVDRLQKLIEDLLKISQLTSEKIEVEYAVVDINQLIGDHLAGWIQQAARRGLEFKVELAPGLPAVLTDAALLAQIIAQLVHNAVSYTPQGQITLSTALHSQGQQRVTVSVADTGPGIAPDELPHIFERFYRGRAAADYKTPGTGVGLSISQDLMSLLHGHITVESEVRRGATFTLWLPAAPAA